MKESLNQEKNQLITFLPMYQNCSSLVNSLLIQNNQLEGLKKENQSLKMENQILIQKCKQYEEQIASSSQIQRQKSQNLQRQIILVNQQKQRLLQQIKTVNSKSKRNTQNKQIQNDSDYYNQQILLQQIQNLQTQFDKLYESVKLGFSEKWSIIQLQKNRKSLQKKEKQIKSQVKGSPSVRQLVKIIKQKIKKFNSTIIDQRMSDHGRKQFQMKMMKIKKHNQLLRQLPFIQAVNEQQQLRKYQHLKNKINNRITQIKENLWNEH